MERSVRLSMIAVIGSALRPAAERTIHGLWNAIGRILDLYPPHECANDFANAGYDAD